MNNGALGAAVLMVSEREDRRMLFDLCDNMGYGPIYSARDFTQARLLLEQDPSIALAVVEFAFKPNAATAFCEQISGDRGKRALIVLGILTPVAGQFLPASISSVHEWVRSPIDPREVAFRLNRVLDPPRNNDTRNRGSDLEDWPLPAFQFDDEDRITQANQRLAQRLGVAITQLTGQLRDAILDFEPHSGESLGWLKVRDGAAQRVRVFQSTRDRGHTVVLMDTEAVSMSRLWLEAVHTSAAISIDQPHQTEAWCQRFCETLGMSLFAVIGERSSSEQEPRLLIGNGAASADGNTDELWEQPIYREVLAEGLLQLDEVALRQRSDPLIRRLRLDWLIGIPLKGEGSRAQGALLAGGSGKLVDAQSTERGLELLASRFSWEWLTQQLRLDSQHQGLHDHLTRLPNRLLFNDRLASAIAEAQRNGELFAVMFVDLDRFKNINDTLGHAIGDQVLLGVSKRMKASVRGSDTIARYAADEFTVVLRHIVNREDVMRIAEKLARVLETPLTLADGSELHITASIGVAFFPDDGNSAEQLLKNADTAMSAAKNMGRNTVQTYVAVAEDSRQQRLALEAKLRVAERNRELRAYYQPKVDARSEDILGMEALIRWEHPELGLISPGFFIPLAEETGLIVPIGEWVLRSACVDCRRWADKFNLPLVVSVNLSALQLKQPGLAQLVKDVLRETGLPAAQLDLEVTESMNVKEIPNLLETLGNLREIGCSISIDDFGTGQSSLEYLKRFPCDAIKVDQTFVRNIGVDPDDEAIIRATINMAHDMGLKVIAEGVETEDHLRFLRGEECEELQGFLFSRPLPGLSFENMLAERERLLRSA